MEWLKVATGINLIHVPYPKGFAPALNDLIGGHVDVMFVNLADAKPLITAGRLNAIAVANPDSVNELPGVSPISREVPGFKAATWFALAAPRATPPSIVEKISQDVTVAMKDPAIIDRLKGLSLTAVLNAPSEAAVFVQEDAQRWQKVINLIGLEPE
jgi:tripartite-type tricarboxylate transporter receptor subunit TctC